MNKKKRGAPLGQHFLIARWAAKAVADAVPIDREDTVLEIGPGKGILTRELLGHSRRVIAIEKDPTLIVKLNETFADEIASGQLLLVEADVRDSNISALLGSKDSDKKPRRISRSYVLIANIPYYITGEIIRSFLTAEAHPKHMSLLVQREVAERIARSTKESILSLSVKAYGTPKMERVVPKRCFNPPPSVDSAILSIRDISKTFFADMREEDFFRIVRASFASKRKLLVNNLSAVAEKDTLPNILEQCGIEGRARAEDVSLDQWKCLVQEIVRI